MSKVQYRGTKAGAGAVLTNSRCVWWSRDPVSANGSSPGEAGDVVVVWELVLGDQLAQAGHRQLLAAPLLLDPETPS